MSFEDDVEKMKPIFQELAEKINLHLEDCSAIPLAKQKIRGGGYEAHITLEMNMFLEKCEDVRRVRRSRKSGQKRRAAAKSPVPSGTLNLTSNDQKFFRALKISLEPEE